MSRIPTPPSIEAAPEGSRPLLETVRARFGVVPNMFRLIANSPAALEGYLGLNGPLIKGALDSKTRERIALAVAELNACSYCLSAHAFLGKRFEQLDEAEVEANRKGSSKDRKADAAVRFAAKLINARGQVRKEDVDDVRMAGYSDGEIVEIVAHVAMNIFTNYVNEAFCTAIDFPLVRPE
jgi:uncharacterized peroxidase-related enzyme